jgi:hypothetical protein
MSLYLLGRDLVSFVENLQRIDVFDYEGLPAHYQEACLIYGFTYGGLDPRWADAVSDSTIKTFERFQTLLVKSRNSRSTSVVDSLKKEFGHTYFFYCLLGPPSDIPAAPTRETE